MSPLSQRILPRKPSPEQAAELCGKIAVVRNEGDRIVARYNRCNRPHFCDFCLYYKANEYNERIANILDWELNTKLFRLDFSIGDEAASERMKRNIRLKKPQLLCYFYHAEGITLITTEDRYGGTVTSLKEIKSEMKRLVLNAPGKRCRIMHYGEVSKVLDIGEPATTEVDLEIFATNAPIAEAHRICETADALVEAFDTGLSLKEKLQSKLDTARVMIEKRGYVVQRISKKSKIRVDIAKTTYFERFDIARLKREWYETAIREGTCF